jgi:hypothetical protein
MATRLLQTVHLARHFQSWADLAILLLLLQS